MTTALLFPGQGSQRVGMGEDLFDRFPDLTAQADQILGYSVRRLCLADSDGVLHRTLYTQPAVYVVNALAYRQLVADRSAEADVLLGHSLGEYNALEAAGVFDFATGLRLVAERARLMDAAQGAMTAVTGLDLTRLQERLETWELSPLVRVAAVNAPRQIVLGGPRSALAEAAVLLHGSGARAVTPLKVSGPFHTMYMTEAAEEFAGFLAAMPGLRPPRIPVIANRTARPHTPERLVVDLVRQIDHPVLWAASIEHILRRDAATTFVEIGTSTTLSSLVRQIRRMHQAPETTQS